MALKAGDLFQVQGGEHVRLLEEQGDGWLAEHITRAVGVRNGTPFVRERAYGDSPVTVTAKTLKGYELVEM